MTNHLKPGNVKGPPDLVGRHGKWLLIGAWVLALAVATWAADQWLDTREARRTAVLLGGGAESGEGVKLRADRYGHFVVIGQVNGVEVPFLVDTGASGISIPEAIAEEIGLDRGIPYSVSTANGTATVFATTLESLAIGPLKQGSVRAHINPGMTDTALLGMSFLRHFELVQRDGELTIRQP